MTFTIKIKHIALIITLFFLACCSNKKFPVFNSQIDNFNVYDGFVNKMTEFDHALTVKKHDNQTDTMFSFKSSQAISKDETGSYYYRWSFTISTFSSNSKAVEAFESRRIEQSQNEDDMRNKGDNSSQIIIQNRIYKISASCLEGHHQNEWFEKLLKSLFKDHKPEKGTILKSYCGGKHERI